MATLIVTGHLVDRRHVIAVMSADADPASRDELRNLTQFTLDGVAHAVTSVCPIRDGITGLPRDDAHTWFLTLNGAPPAYGSHLRL